MFTGIVEELARVKKIKTKKKGIRYTISANTVLDDLEIGDLYQMISGPLNKYDFGGVIWT